MLTLLLSILSILSYSVYGHYGCGADRIKNKTIYKNWNVKPVETRLNKDKHNIFDGRAQDPDNSGIYNNIRIHYDTSQLESDWSSYSLKSYFVDSVIPAAYQWLQKVISVRPVDGPLTFSVPCNSNVGTIWTTGPNAGKCSSPNTGWQTCGATGAVIPANMFDEMEKCSTGLAASCETTTFPQGSGRADTDLIVYFTGDASKDNANDCGKAMGFAAYCHTNSRNRPIAGYVNLCRSVIDDTEVLTWEEAISLIIHETFHVLGFNSDGFDSFINDDGSTRTDVYAQITKRGKKRAVITLPTVVEKAKEFFDCDSMDGIELEDYDATSNGEPTSHWENRIIIYDFMISYVPPAAPYSIFTLAVLEDSGWYNIDWKYGQEAPHGRKAGCNWYNNTCISSEGSIDDKAFCAADVKYSCGSSYVGKFYCGLSVWPQSLPSEYQYFTQSDVGGDNVYPDFCPLLEEYSNADCRLYGSNNVGTSDENTVIGGLISGTSKCALIHGDTNGMGAGCYPTHCFRDYKGDYVGVRRTIYRNYKETAFDVMTCWDEDDEEEQTFPYDPNPSIDLGFRTIFCPVITDICYDENPWICNGHGTIVDGSCVCSPGYIGIDCTIENNKENRNKYTNSSSVNRYIDAVCDGGAVWSYSNDDGNVGIVNITINGINDAVYDEEYFQTAIKNWMAIATDIAHCKVVLKNYIYASSTITTDIYYYSSSKTFKDSSVTLRGYIFSKLFASSYTGFEYNEIKESAGEHEDNQDMAIMHSFNFIVSFTIIYIGYLL